MQALSVRSGKIWRTAGGKIQLAADSNCVCCWGNCPATYTVTLVFSGTFPPLWACAAAFAGTYTLTQTDTDPLGRGHYGGCVWVYQTDTLLIRLGVDSSGAPYQSIYMQNSDGTCNFTIGSASGLHAASSCGCPPPGDYTATPFAGVTATFTVA